MLNSEGDPIFEYRYSEITAENKQHEEQHSPGSETGQSLLRGQPSQGTGAVPIPHTPGQHRRMTEKEIKEQNHIFSQFSVV